MPSPIRFRTLCLPTAASIVALAAGCGSASAPVDDAITTEALGESASAISTIPIPAPRGYWRFDDCAAGSTQLRDVSGFNLGGTASGGVTCNRTGHPGIAAAFDGTSGKIEIPDDAAFDAAIGNALTVAAWVKPTAVPTSSSRSYAIATKWDNRRDTFKLQLTSTGYKFTIAFPSGSGAERQVAIQAPASLSTTAWTHVAGVYDGARGTVTLYVNGAAAATASASGTLQTSTAPLRIGNSPASGGVTYPFKGSIDEAWIAGAPLSKAQLQVLAAGPHSDQWGACTETPKKSNVLVVVLDPYLPDRGQHLVSYLAGNDPEAFSAQIVDTFRETSGGILNYDIIGTRVLDQWTPQREGAMPLNEANFFNPPTGGGYTEYAGGNADYARFFQEQGICELVRTQNLSEVWVWSPSVSGSMGFGFDELAYRIPNDDLHYPTNNFWFYEGRKKNIPDCGKTVWVMGWNTNVGLDNALHSYNHRIESILSLTVGQGRWFDTVDPQNPWRLFSLGENTAPGKGQIGTVHSPVNAGSGGASPDYDYVNTGYVSSGAADWASYPKLTGATQSINCAAWGCTQLGYQKWYQSHLPHASGTSYGGSCNDWWTYIADYDRRLANCSGSDCQEQLPNGQTCASDSQCASGTCACNATGTRLVCSPSGTPRACPVQPKPNWELCDVDGDCQSGVCGCNFGPPPKVCLPNEQYPRACN
jgi:hypothetical protein